MQKVNHLVADFHVAAGSRSTANDRDQLLDSLLPQPMTQRTSRYRQGDRSPSGPQTRGTSHHVQADLMLRQATMTLGAYLQSAAQVAVMAGS
jgi:hypothetical protein